VNHGEPAPGTGDRPAAPHSEAITSNQQSVQQSLKSPGDLFCLKISMHTWK